MTIKLPAKKVIVDIEHIVFLDCLQNKNLIIHKFLIDKLKQLLFLDKLRPYTEMLKEQLEKLEGLKYYFLA